MNTQFKERPILFSSEMVRAILDGRKTQTRRIVKSEIALDWLDNAKFNPEFVAHPENDMCKYGKVGDRLWVRETFAIVPRTAYAQSDNCQQIIKPNCNHDAAIFRAGWERSTGGICWKPSIHMPRWASRITLEITSIRVERLHEIKKADAISEGTDWKKCPSHQTADSFRDQKIARSMGMASAFSAEIDYVSGFKILWESINGVGSWSKNPWVWVVEFKRVT